jgi:hypothetical protein
MAFTRALAQDLNSMKGQKLVSFHGSIGAGASFYSSNEAYPTQDPFSWNLYGSFTPSFYGFALPFSFVITQYSKSYTSPFTQFGISPSYKWIKLHLGYRSIAFSPLVFDGQSFLGAGIELSPKGFYLGAFYGRLNKAVSEDTTYGQILEPQYARTGFGIKIGVGTRSNNFSIQFFHASDDTSSIHRIKDSLTTILPEDNTVLGSSWHLLFFKRLSFTGDIAASLFNRDLSYAEIDSIGNVKIPRLIQKLAPVNYSSVLSFSGQSQLMLTLNHFNVSAGYRRVEPDFKSLGVPYALDDIEMITGNVGTNLIKGKISINAAFNTQHNNLSHMLSSELQTHTGNININSFVSQHVNINLNITGVQVYQQDGLLKLSDSVRMNQVMWNATLSPTFNFSGVTHQHTVNFNTNYTDLNDHNPVTSAQAGCKSFSSSLSYSVYFTRAYWGINTNLLYSQYNQPLNTYQSLGLNIGASVQLLKEHSLALQGSVGYFLNHDSNMPAGNNTTFSFNGSYQMNRHHSLGLYTSYVITPPVNLNPLNIVNHVPYAVNSKNLAGGITYAYHF